MYFNILRFNHSYKARHVARMGRGEVCTGFRWEYLREKDHLEDPGLDETIIFR